MTSIIDIRIIFAILCAARREMTRPDYDHDAGKGIQERRDERSNRIRGRFQTVSIAA